MWTIAQWGIAWCVVSVLTAYVLGRTIMRSGKDAETEEAEALVSEFIIDNDELLSKIVEASKRFAWAKDVSIRDASNLCIKAAFSPTYPLSRYGIEVNGEVGSNDRINSVRDGIEDAFNRTGDAK